MILSLEPLLGPIDLRPMFEHRAESRGDTGVDWVIVGGESGPKARPMLLDWAKDVVRQCRAAGVPVLVKQLGARPTNREGEPHPMRDRKGGDMDEWPEELRVREFPHAP